MNNDASFQRLSGITSILAALLAFGSIGFQAVVLGVTTDPFSNPTAILGIGFFLRREQPALGIFTSLLGIFALLDTLGRILNIKIIYTVGLGGMLLFIPIWSLWFGIDLLRSRKMGDFHSQRTINQTVEQ